MSDHPEHPKIPFTSLPLNPDGPPGNAWGRFGASDQLGTLNLLTPATTTAAAKEIRSGIRISLDWPLNKPRFPFFGRDPLEHSVRTRGETGRPVNDDLLRFNTQGSSQWDGFRHYGYMTAKRFYNDATSDALNDPSVLGIDEWATAGGIVGRGVLLDYKRWADKHSIPLQPFTTSTIPLSDLQLLISEQQIQFHPGDILFIRSGFSSAYNALTESEQRELANRPVPEFLGLESSEQVLRWLWENQFAAVAGDAPSFESSPVGGKDKTAPPPPFVLHSWLLAGWGMPIGELFDLEALAEYCDFTGRRTFFVSSMPLKVPGGVASPPNAVAIF